MSRKQNKKRDRPVDMSLPSDQRHRRRRQQRIGGTPPAQADHASGSKAARLRRDGERHMELERRLREDTAAFAGEIADLDEDAALDRTGTGHEQ